MPLGVISHGVSRGMGVLDGVGDRRRERSSFGGKYGASHSIVTNGDFVAYILCREKWRRGSSQITLRFLLYVVAILKRTVIELYRHGTDRQIDGRTDGLLFA